MGRPAHSISVPVVCALHKGLEENIVSTCKSKENYLSDSNG
jgi:hypothetical protein